jgi:hypothetical protein
MLFGEIHRLLKPDGVFVADTEFLEQHASLWIVDYFPSLKKRFENCLFSRNQYSEWLTAAGFRGVEFKTCQYSAEEGDAFLRVGQNDPNVYLNPDIRSGIPAFQVMDPMERRQGVERLRVEIGTGEVIRVRDRYLKAAELPGDLGFIIARK